MTGRPSLALAPAADYAALFAAHGLDSFDALWDMTLPYVDAPNLDRGGWSVVSRLELIHANGGSVPLYLKRQRNHLSRSLRYPFGEPTFAREFRAIQNLRQCGVPTVEPVCFGQRTVGGEHQALLITRALDGHRSLDEWYRQWWHLPRAVRTRLTVATAGLVSRLHDSGLIHNSLYPKHLFLRLEEQTVDARLIDLETARPNWWGWRDRVRDLEALHRRSLIPSMRERVLFVRHYLGERVHTAGLDQWLLRAIRTRSQRRR